jgi:hypothetical protein
MSNLPALSNAAPLVSRVFAKMSKKRQRCAVINIANNFSVINSYPRMSDKIGFTVKQKAVLLEC